MIRRYDTAWSEMSSHHCTALFSQAWRAKNKLATSNIRFLKTNIYLSYRLHVATHVHSIDHGLVLALRLNGRKSIFTSARGDSIPIVQYGSLVIIHSVYRSARSRHSLLVQILTLHEPQSKSQNDLDPPTTAKRHLCRLRCNPKS